MAQKVEILITAKNAVAKGIRGAQNALRGFGASAASMASKTGGAVAATAAAVVGLGAKLITLFEEQTRAEITLANAHRMAGEDAKYLVAQEVKAAGAIAKEVAQTRSSVTAIMARMRLLGVQSASLEKATRATYALAAAGLDEGTAARAVTQAMGGNYTMLQRLSPELRNAKTAAEKLAAFNKICEAGYASLTEQMGTFTGQTKRAKSELQELVADIGGLINKNGWATGLAENFGNNIAGIRRNLNAAFNGGMSEDEKRLRAINVELDALDARLSGGMSKTQAFWAEWRKAGAKDKVWMVGRYNSQTERENVVNEAAQKHAARLQERMDALEKEKAELIKRRADAERAAWDAAQKHQEEEAAKMQRIRDLYARLIKAKKKYYDAHEQKKAIADKEQELEMARRLHDAEERRKRQEREAFEAERKGAEETLEAKREILEMDFKTFSANAREAAKQEKERNRADRRSDAALEAGRRIEERLAHGGSEKGLTRRQREQLEYYRQTRDAVAAAGIQAGNAVGRQDAGAAINNLEQQIKDAQDNIANREAVSFDDTETAQTLKDALTELKDGLDAMAPQADVRQEIAALEKALADAKAGSETWQARQLELEKEQADNSASMAEILKTVEGLLQGQSEYLQKNLEGI